MEDLFEGFSENITEWETIRGMIELDLDDPPNNDNKIDHRIHCFPRQDYPMYGMIPKMEHRIYVKCNDCKLIFNLLDIMYHKTCAGTSTPSKSHASERKTKSRSGSNKKNLNNFIIPPVLAKTSSPNRAHNKDKELYSRTSKLIVNQSAASSKVQEMMNTVIETETKGSSPDVPSPSCLSNDSLSLDGDSSSPIFTSSTRNGKKSRKVKSTKEFDPDLHCGVIDAHKGPCLRSITCSNHRIQLKKLVPGRSRDIQQLITQKRLAKERDLLNQSGSENYKVETVSEVDQMPVIIATPFEILNHGSSSEAIDVKQNVVDCVEEVVEVKDDLNHSEDFIEVLQDSKHLDDFKFPSIDLMSPIHEKNSMPSLENFEFSHIHPLPHLKEGGDITSLDNLKFTSIDSLNMENGIKSFESFDFTQLNPLSPFNDGFDLKLYKFDEIQPMSPLNEELVIKEECFISETVIKVPLTDDRPVVFKIPDIDVEESTTVGFHPKPIELPNYGTKKIGGAIQFNKSHSHSQRNDILRAVNDFRINCSLFDDTSMSKKKRNHCNLSFLDEDMEFKQMRLDPNLNHFLMQCEIRKPFDDVLLEECLQENFDRNSFGSTIDFE